MKCILTENVNEIVDIEYLCGTDFQSLDHSLLINIWIARMSTTI